MYIPAHLARGFGNSASLGGAIVDSGNFPWAQHKQRFRRLNEPDVSYHGVVYIEALGPAAYIGRASSSGRPLGGEAQTSGQGMLRTDFCVNPPDEALGALRRLRNLRARRLVLISIALKSGGRCCAEAEPTMAAAVAANRSNGFN